jgi:hypothetical protein
MLTRIVSAGNMCGCYNPPSHQRLVPLAWVGAVLPVPLPRLLLHRTAPTQGKSFRSERSRCRRLRCVLCVAGSGQRGRVTGQGGGFVLRRQPVNLRWLGCEAQIPGPANDLPESLGGRSCWLDQEPDRFARLEVNFEPGAAGPADLGAYCVGPGLDADCYGLPGLDVPTRPAIHFQGVGPQGIAVMAARPGEDDLCALFHEPNDYTGRGSTR